MLNLESGALLTENLANRAADIAYNTFQEEARNAQIKRPDLHIIIMDPTKPFGYGGSFEDAILCEIRWGNPDEIYRSIALEKAEVTWRTGRPSHDVQQDAPHLLKKRNTKWGGSAIHEGQVVACSGVEWFNDQFYSQVLAATCVRLCIQVMQENVLPNNEIKFMHEYVA